MSLKSLQACMARTHADEEFAKKIISCQDSQTRLSLLEAEGFPLTPEELGKLSIELNDCDLEWVAGGKKSPWDK